MQQIKVKVVVDRELEPLNPQQIRLRDAFTHYKELSLSKGEKNFITPPIGIQTSFPSDHGTFGRDTEFEKPEDLINDILEYNLSKVHVDTRATWKPTAKQWYCTSNESIVYSGFKMPCDTYCLVIIDFLIDEGAVEGFDSHENYSREDIDEFLDIAHENREEILSK
ncbi:type II toxin-antitoxin system YafO family toxin [Vibrio parahaemolyticus]|nr:type II toxin-antitoxin system YafO family toxin [Vibrio parahaemolyticus]MDF4466183.1 type II toxin-antitoxin system YafO family toxin [Vibrio parahaemolyticus]MDF4471066.1 type II toxin-antitoxin system YafO family toxin [Vibrio parahaemolyticus]MDF4493038.1 type II toxin-antitoxin system YafO family toxin [Vibrio parahaemolyticus]MDG2569734.1 type II toxin-antitoxin system YafO family toxin [Vibrio parahaemolyticus]